MQTTERKADKVAIVGFAPSWKEAPFDSKPEECEIWCLNEMYRVAPEIKSFRASRWFEIHDLTTPSKNTKEHQSFLQTVTVPLYVQKKYEHLPNAIVFPWEEMFKYFEDKGVLGARYFTSSIAYFVAFAIYLGFKEIEIWGVDMATSSEYQGQRNCVEFWIGLATGLGIKVYVPPSSDLLKCSQLYALQSSNKNRVWIKTQVQELKKRTQQFAQQEHQAQQADLQAKLAQAELRGAMSAYNEILVRTQ
jgi:hypothetical protein